MVFTLQQLVYFSGNTIFEILNNTIEVLLSVSVMLRDYML